MDQSSLESRDISAIDFVAFDFETTGLNPTTDRIIEIGAVRFRDRATVGEFQTMVDPQMPIPPASTDVSGITDAMVAGAPPTEEAIGRFLAFASGAVLIAHNAPFDMGFLRNAVERLGLPQPGNLVIDTQVLASKAFPMLRSYALQNLVDHFSFPRNNAHRALDDSTMCRRVFERCADQLSFMGSIPLSDLLT